jgi:hypothetical protein
MHARATFKKCIYLDRQSRLPWMEWTLKLNSNKTAGFEQTLRGPLQTFYILMKNEWNLKS